MSVLPKVAMTVGGLVVWSVALLALTLVDDLAALSDKTTVALMASLLVGLMAAPMAVKKVA